MDKKTITLTIVANMTSNYSEGLGNIASIQKVYRKGHVYAIRSRESLKNAIMVQSGMYDDLVTTVDGAAQKTAQKAAAPERNVANNRALEGGYMTTGKNNTYIRNSSFYLTDAIACEPFVSENRFHNNLYLAGNYAKANNLNLQKKDAGAVGLMPYQYEYEKSLRVYSMTIDLGMIGSDSNFNEEADGKEKADRVNSLLSAVENLSLVVKGNLDNAEPIFVVGGFSDRRTHYFENVVKVINNKLELSEDLIQKKNRGYSAALLRGHNFENEDEIIEKLNPVSVGDFFDELRNRVQEYYA